jgi:hypothetical protein
VVTLEGLGQNEKWAFFINLYHLMIIHAQVPPPLTSPAQPLIGVKTNPEPIERERSCPCICQFRCRAPICQLSALLAIVLLFTMCMVSPMSMLTSLGDPLSQAALTKYVVISMYAPACVCVCVCDFALVRVCVRRVRVRVCVSVCDCVCLCVCMCVCVREGE